MGTEVHRPSQVAEKAAGVNMRKKLLKLLRELETESGFKNEYFDTDEGLDCDFSVDEYLDFPDFRFVIKRFNEENVVMRDELVIPYTSNSIRGELKRMEADGLVMIGTQEGKRWASVSRGNGPEIENASFTTESIVLTTQGKSGWQYTVHEFFENPFTSIPAVLALIISIVALFI